MENKTPIIRMDGLGKAFTGSQGTVRALEDISLEIMPGEIFGIIGLSGAGKSTLVRCMNYLEVPTEGEVYYDGKPLSEMQDAELRKVRQSMGMIFQQFNLLAQRTVLGNICFPMEIAGTPREEAKARARELLKLVGLEDRENAYPAQLSGGQKQRVAIARAIATNPKVLLCDEATSALDPNTTKAILQLLKEINQSMGITVVIITHEMAVIEAVCDRVAIIDKSHIAEIGEVSRVFAEPKSKIGRQLILGDAAEKVEFGTGRLFRIIFDGLASSEPVISNVVLACKVPVNIMYAATRDIKGKAAGQMIIELPDHEPDIERVLQYLDRAKVPYEEVFRRTGKYPDHDVCIVGSGLCDRDPPGNPACCLGKERDPSQPQGPGGPGRDHQPDPFCSVPDPGDRHPELHQKAGGHQRGNQGHYRASDPGVGPLCGQDRGSIFK